MFPRQVRTPFPHPNAPGPWSHLFSNPAHLANLPVISLFPLPKLHHFCAPLLSAPSRGTWIEMMALIISAVILPSSPSRGTWIEIRVIGRGKGQSEASSPSRGTWIEILRTVRHTPQRKRRPPHGGRGLKSAGAGVRGVRMRSSPSRGTWIEISGVPKLLRRRAGRPPHGGRGLKLLRHTPKGG